MEWDVGGSIRDWHFLGETKRKTLATSAGMSVLVEDSNRICLECVSVCMSRNSFSFM